MLKLANACVTASAKQTAYFVGFFAMVYMQAFAIWCASAYCAFSVLRNEHGGVSACFKTESSFERRIFFLFWIFSIPFFVVRSVFFWFGFVIRANHFNVARFASALQTVVGVFVFVKLRAKFYGFAHKTMFVSRGVAGELCHANHLKG